MRRLQTATYVAPQLSKVTLSFSCYLATSRPHKRLTQATHGYIEPRRWSNLGLFCVNPLCACLYSFYEAFSSKSKAVYCRFELTVDTTITREMKGAVSLIITLLWAATFSPWLALTATLIVVTYRVAGHRMVVSTGRLRIYAGNTVKWNIICDSVGPQWCFQRNFYRLSMQPLCLFAGIRMNLIFALMCIQQWSFFLRITDDYWSLWDSI